MAFAGTGKIWMNGKLVDWKDANIHIASHVIHYGSGVFEGARVLRHAEGLGDSSSRRAHGAAARVGQDLPDGLAPTRRSSSRRPSSTPFR